MTRTRTEKSQRKPIVHSNTTLKNDQVIPPPAGGGRGAPGGGRGGGRGAYKGGRSGGTGQGKPVGAYAKKCRLCEELTHFTHQCPFILETKDQKAIQDTLKKKKVFHKTCRV